MYNRASDNINTNQLYFKIDNISGQMYLIPNFIYELLLKEKIFNQRFSPENNLSSDVYLYQFVLRHGLNIFNSSASYIQHIGVKSICREGRFLRYSKNFLRPYAWNEDFDNNCKNLKDGAKKLIIDFTKKFKTRGFGNIVFMLGIILTYVKNKNIQLFVNINNNMKNFANDLLCAINYLKFDQFNFSILNDSNLNQFNVINKISNLNNEDVYEYIINNDLDDIGQFFNYDKIIQCFLNLNIEFKEDKVNEIKTYINSKFNNIERSIIINVRRR